MGARVARPDFKAGRTRRCSCRMLPEPPRVRLSGSQYEPPDPLSCAELVGCPVSRSGTPRRPRSSKALELRRRRRIHAADPVLQPLRAPRGCAPRRDGHAPGVAVRGRGDHRGERRDQAAGRARGGGPLRHLRERPVLLSRPVAVAADRAGGPGLRDLALHHGGADLARARDHQRAGVRRIASAACGLPAPRGRADALRAGGTHRGAARAVPDVSTGLARLVARRQDGRHRGPRRGAEGRRALAGRAVAAHRPRPRHRQPASVGRLLRRDEEDGARRPGAGRAAGRRAPLLPADHAAALPRDPAAPGSVDRPPAVRAEPLPRILVRDRRPRSGSPGSPQKVAPTITKPAIVCWPRGASRRRRTSTCCSRTTARRRSTTPVSRRAKATTLLAQIQNAILDLTDLARGSVALAADDRSVEVHVCHSTDARARGAAGPAARRSSPERIRRARPTFWS